MDTVKFFRYESFVFVGIIIAIGALIKILGIYNFSSDWFWLLAGFGLVIEGLISLVKQKKFDKKYKIVDRNGEEIK